MVNGKMTGKDLDKTRAPQGVGVKTVKEFISLAGLEATKRTGSGGGGGGFLGKLAVCCG